jgi:NhaC family Na+:H+ antiporter
MVGMFNTVWLIIRAMVLGGIMKACRMIESVMQSFMRMIKGRASMISMLVASGAFFNLVLANQYLAILLTGNMYVPIFKSKC